MTKKAYLFLIITLIMGILMGVVLDNLLDARRFKKMSERMHEPMGFTEGLSRMLDLSEAQLDTLKPLLDLYAEKSLQHREEARITHQAEMDSMFVKMLPYLTAEQARQVEEIMKEDGPDRPFMPWFGKPPVKGQFFGGPPPGDKRPPKKMKPGDRERGNNPPPDRF